jgi:RNA recognition motif-containing protein
LDESIDEKFLRSYLCLRYRSVYSVKIVIDFKMNQSKGYGFVKFLDAQEYERALSELNGRTLRNKTIRVK